MVEVVRLPPTSSNDVPAMLRRIADDIEAGRWGDVPALGVVLYGTEGFEVFGGGRDGNSPQIVQLLMAGVMRLTRRIEEHGGCGS